ncbi:lysophospholipid acyltransferase family protein [Lichenicoccus sp.]|uniref:lysophospholipid acyltransferase family protein n=1 Tax=Lichenicoccus sp. TaxID=2781899 RepID=UPI003D1135B7
MTLVRAGLFNLYFCLLTVAMGLGAFWIRWFAREHALAYAGLWCRLTLHGLRVICGIRIALTGVEHLPEGPVLIASQHQSAFDTLVWLTLVRRPAYVMKRELTRLPLVGPMLLLAGMIPVDRQAGAKALRALLRHADAAVAEGRQIVIFPEGTRVAAGESVALQPGVAALAAHTRLPVVPVTTDSGRCWSRRAFVKRPGTIHIAIGPAICPEQLRGRPRAALLEAIRSTWASEEVHFAAAVCSAGRDSPVDKSVGSMSRQV